MCSESLLNLFLKCKSLSIKLNRAFSNEHGQKNILTPRMQQKAAPLYSGFKTSKLHFIKTHFNKLTFIENITLAFILLICPSAKLSYLTCKL